MRCSPFWWLMSMCLVSSAATLAHLPNAGINAIKIDASGNIYIAGYQGPPGTSASMDAFVAKLSPDGSSSPYTDPDDASQRGRRAPKRSSKPEFPEHLIVRYPVRSICPCAVDPFKHLRVERSFAG